VSRATFVSSSMALARTPIPSAGIESLSVPVEVALTPDGFAFIDGELVRLHEALAARDLAAGSAAARRLFS
jgi:hypothetical protein